MSSFEKECWGLLLDHVNVRSNSRTSCNRISVISWLKAIIECVLGLFEVVSSISRKILKSPNRIQGKSCMHAMIRSSCKKSHFRSLSVGPYMFVIMNWNPLLLIASVEEKWEKEDGANA
jgi:hypothetical protein